MIWSVLLASLALLTADAPAAAASCAPADIAAQGRAVAAARERLRAVPLEEMQTEVDAETRGGIEAVKDRVAAFVASAVGCAGAGEAPDAIRERLVAGGGAGPDARVFDASEPFQTMHGASLSFEVAVPPGHPNLLAVVARLGIACGEDGMLMLFERGGGVRPLMVRRSAPYDEVSGSWDGLRYAVSPAGADRRWYVAVSHSPSWCTSAWSALRYDLSRPGADPALPHIFFSRRVGHYRDNDGGALLRAESGRFQVEHDGGIVDPSIVVRRHVESYSVDGDDVRRTQPAAFNVRDFVDAWLGERWDQARAWSAGGGEIEAAHRAIGAESRSDEISFEFGPIRACPDGTHEVTLEASRASAPGWSVTVSGRGPYRIEQASRAASGRCGGPDLREEIEAESRRRIEGAPTS